MVASIAGYALFLTLTAFVLWGGYLPVFLHYSSVQGIVGLDFIARWSAFPLTFLLAGGILRIKPQLLERLPFATPLIFVTCGGVFLFVATVVTALEALIVLLSLCFAVGSALFFIYWTHEIASQSDYSCGVIVIVAAGISPLIYFLVTLMPLVLNTVVELFVIAPASLLLLYYVHLHSEHDQPMYRSVPQEQIGVVKKAVQQLWRPVLCIASIGFIVGFVRSLTSSDAALIELFNTISMLALFFSCIILLALWGLARFAFNLDIIYKISFPLAATCFLLLPLFGSGYTLLVAVISFLLFNMVSALMVITCVQIARALALQPAFVYSITAGLVYLVSSSGSMVGVVSDNTGFGPTQFLVLALAGIYVFSLVVSLPQRRKGDVPASAQEDANEQQNPVERQERQVADIISLQCEELQSRYGLSDREREIATLMARGRDVPYIATSLVISPNTVRSHSKNIFRKLDVHAKQEFLDLVESCSPCPHPSVPQA
jgi:DNA-binding CsgD family transcriptional regulator